MAAATGMGRPLLAEKPKMRELQMNWLRSEDLKEEKNVTAPVTMIAGVVLGRCWKVARRRIGTCADSM